MTGASFNTINQKDGGMWLSQMSVSGYKDVSVFQAEGVLAQFQIKVLDKNGGTAKDTAGLDRIYDFYNVREDGEWQGEMWCQGDDIVVEEDLVVFDPGEGLWFYVEPTAYPTGKEVYSLLNSGEAIMDAGAVPVREGYKGIVAPLSAPVWLSKVSINGYEDVSVFQAEGVLAQFQIKVLDKNGGTAKDAAGLDRIYDFYNVREEGEWQGEMWCQGDDIVVEEDMVVFDPGEGVWFYVAPECYPTGKEVYSVVFPGIDDMTK